MPSLTLYCSCRMPSSQLSCCDCCCCWYCYCYCCCWAAGLAPDCPSSNPHCLDHELIVEQRQASHWVLSLSRHDSCLSSCPCPSSQPRVNARMQLSAWQWLIAAIESSSSRPRHWSR